MRSFSDFDGRFPCVECPLTIVGSAVTLVCIATSWAVLGLSARLLQHEFPFPTQRPRPRLITGGTSSYGDEATPRCAVHPDQGFGWAFIRPRPNQRRLPERCAVTTRGHSGSGSGYTQWNIPTSHTQPFALAEPRCCATSQPAAGVRSYGRSGSGDYAVVSLPVSVAHMGRQAPASPM